MDAEMTSQPVAAPQPAGPTRPALTPPLDLLKASFRSYRESFGRLTGILVWPIVILTVVLVAPLVLSPSLVGGGFISIVIFVGFVLMYAAGLALIYSIKTGEGIVPSFKYAFRNFFSYLWLLVLVGMIAVGGTLMLVIPGIIFNVWFFAAALVFVDLGRKGFDALMTSKEYVRGYWWPVVWRMLVFGLTVGLAVLIIVLLATGLGETIGSFVEQLIQLFVIPLSTWYLWLVYRDLVRVKPDLVAAPAPEKGKGFFIFSAVLGVVFIVAMFLFIGFILATLGFGSVGGGLDPGAEYNFQDLEQFNTINGS
jgi:hypothetical protein